MNNYEIADAFSLLAKLMDIHGENSFKSKSYSNAAFQIEKLPEQLADMSAEAIAAARGIGSAIQQKIDELLQTGQLRLLRQYIDQTPEGILQMMQIKGLGAKKINTIWKEMGIESIGELQYACYENRLVRYKGFGEKTQQNVLEAIQFFLNHQGQFLYQQAEAWAQHCLQFLQTQLPADSQLALTGSMRRQALTIDCIDILSTATATQVQQALAQLPALQMLTADEVQLHYQIENGPKLLVHLTDAAHWGSRLFATTGGQLAAQPDALPVPPCANEESLFAHWELPFIAAPLRDLPDIAATARQRPLPALIQPTDIKGIIHSHSTWSDGAHTIATMAQAAKQAGLEYLVISDHSKAAAYANGLTEERILQQHAEIEDLNQQLAPFRIFKSIECDILGDGSLDYADDVLASFDLVIASVHSNLKMTEEKAMQRLLAAIAHPATTILGHPTGRLLLSRQGYPIDHERIIDACARHGVAIELNAHPRRLDIDWTWIPKAVAKGVMISINPDAHAVEGFADTRYGVLAAQKGMLTAAQNLSSLSLTAFEAYLAKRKSGRA
ncbi:MAG: helix-hairpin-helix domain-containing protein [Chitinophagaceae bacterium]|nr:helix-hairpin-helix domain-containing protein [Chitinophagaceae bacterium]